MNFLKDDEFKRKISETMSGGYLFFGDEDYLKAHALDSIKKILCPDSSLEMFNLTRFDALNFTPDALLSVLEPLPMMAERKAVFIEGINFSAMKATELELLYAVLDRISEYDHNTVIFSVPKGYIDEGNLPKRPSAILSALSEHITPVRFAAVSDARLAAWIAKHFEHRGVISDREVCEFLITYCGKSMTELVFEIEKAAHYVCAAGRNTVTTEDIRHVAVATLDADAFLLANSLLDSKYKEALHAVEVMKHRRVDPIILLSEVSSVIVDLLAVKVMADSGKPHLEISKLLKMNEYKVRLYLQKSTGRSMEKLKKAIELCSQSDLSLKLGGGDYLIIEKLVCSL